MPIEAAKSLGPPVIPDNPSTLNISSKLSHPGTDSICAITSIFLLVQLAKSNFPPYSLIFLSSLNSVPLPPPQDLFPEGGNKQASAKSCASFFVSTCGPTIP